MVKPEEIKLHPGSTHKGPPGAPEQKTVPKEDKCQESYGLAEHKQTQLLKFCKSHSAETKVCTTNYYNTLNKISEQL